MARSKFDQASFEKTLKVVEMNKVEFLRFRPGHLCLGTQNLNSCTTVIIVSKDAAILAHIAPRPSSSNSNQATGDQHAKAKMAEMSTLLSQHLDDFKLGPGGIIVYAVYNGQSALQDQKQIIEAHYAAWKLPLKSVPYQVLDAGKKGGIAKGQVLIDARQGLPIVWIEDRQVGEVKIKSSSAAGSSKAGSAK